MGFASLGSGSKGNGTLVSINGALFLVDCGFTLKQTEKRIARLGLSVGDIDAVFVTHEHSDHCNGVGPLAHKFGLPVYASYGTAKACLSQISAHTFDGDVASEVCGVQVNPVRVPHDAKEPTQFVFSSEQEKIGVLSDVGKPTAHLIEQFNGCDYLLLEANHDPQMLAAGSYPPMLKRRVGGDYGHLSNEQAQNILAKVGHENLTVVIGHTSEQNNSVQLLANQFTAEKFGVAQIVFATQQDGFDWVGTRPIARQISFGNVGG